MSMDRSFMPDPKIIRIDDWEVVYDRIAKLGRGGIGVLSHLRVLHAKKPCAADRGAVPASEFSSQNSVNFCGIRSNALMNFHIKMGTGSSLSMDDHLDQTDGDGSGEVKTEVGQGVGMRRRRPRPASRLQSKARGAPRLASRENGVERLTRGHERRVRLPLGPPKADRSKLRHWERITAMCRGRASASSHRAYPTAGRDRQASCLYQVSPHLLLRDPQAPLSTCEASR